MEEKKCEARGHSRRLQRLAVDFGEYFGLSERLAEDLVLLAALHDIGKTAVPE